MYNRNEFLAGFHKNPSLTKIKPYHLDRDKSHSNIRDGQWCILDYEAFYKTDYVVRVVKSQKHQALDMEDIKGLQKMGILS